MREKLKKIKEDLKKAEAEKAGKNGDESSADDKKETEDKPDEEDVTVDSGNDKSKKPQ